LDPEFLFSIKCSFQQSFYFNYSYSKSKHRVIVIDNFVLVNKNITTVVSVPLVTGGQTHVRTFLGQDPQSPINAFHSSSTRFHVRSEQLVKLLILHNRINFCRDSWQYGTWPRFDVKILRRKCLVSFILLRDADAFLQLFLTAKWKRSVQP